MNEDLEKYPQRLKEQLLELYAEDQLIDGFRGASTVEIAEISALVKKGKLPGIYLHWLSIMGRYVDIDRHMNVFDRVSGFMHLPDLQEDFKNMAKTEQVSLSDDAFCFGTNEGVYYYFFPTNSGSENPPVYVTYGGAPELHSESLIEFLDKIIGEYLIE